MKPSKLLVFLSFAFVVGGCGGCDETATSVQADYMHRHTDAFVFHADRARIVAGLRSVIADEGLELADATIGTDTIETTRGVKADGSTEYAIHIITASAGTLVHIQAKYRDRDGKVYSSTRDTAMEWELAQRVEPDRTLEITNAANQRADQVAPRAHKAPL